MRRQPNAPASAVKRAAIYTRKSTTMGLEQEFNSLDAQHEACVAYIGRLGWTLVDERYDDGGFTGANTDRPAFQRLLADVAAGKVDVVVVYKVDRLSRSLLDFAKVMEQLNASGASFVSVTQNFSTADAMGRMTLGLLMTFAQFEREMTAERTRDKVLAARRRGRWTGGHTPFGYDLHDGKLIVNAVEAVAVREAFDLLLQYRRPSDVARALNRQGHFPRGAKLAPGKPPRWTKVSAAKLLRLPIYAGLIRAGAELAQAEHQGIVTPELFAQVQRILDDGGTAHEGHGRNDDYVLRGLLRCGLCGAAMTPASTRKGTRQYRYYRCSTRDKVGSEECAAAPLPAGAIEEFVVARVREASHDRSLVADVRDALEEKLRHRRAELNVLRRGLPTRIANLSASSSRLADELSRATGRAHDVIQAKLAVEGDTLTATERQLANARREWDELDGLVAEADWVAATLADFDKVWDVLTPPNRGRLLRALIARIVVNEAAGHAEVHLVDFSAPVSAQEAA